MRQIVLDTETTGLDWKTGDRLIEIAGVEIIDRNLYERSCDVRWWATDSAVVDALEQPSEAARAHAEALRAQALAALAASGLTDTRALAALADMVVRRSH